MTSSDDEDVEFDAGSSRSITYASPSSFFRSINSEVVRDFGYTTSSVMDITDNDLVVGMQFESKQTTYTFAKRICDQSAPPTSSVNPVQSLSNFYSTGREMMETLAMINPTAYSTNYFEAPPTQHFHMPQTESPQQTHVETHYQAHTPQQQHLYGFHNYSSTHLSSSSQFSLRPSMFATSSSTPLSAYDSQQYYRPTMPPTNIFRIQHTVDEVVIEDDNDEDEEEEEEEEEQPQLATRARGTISQRNEQQLRVQPSRRRKPPPCDTSSHRRH
ncbi:hypothetical protein Lal_00029960 [Lupinus albus]|nr:hypothetical protein Lal_00029960 [Lupinus albus]